LPRSAPTQSAAKPPTSTDRNYVSIGCATLFLNYLRYQREFPWIRIVQAGGATLAATYKALTGRTDALQPFAALLQSRFPAGTPSGLNSDNPFPINRHLWHTLRTPDGKWSGLGDVQGQFAIPGPVAAVAGAAGAVPGETQWMLTTSDGHLWHTARNPNGTWSGLGDVEGQFAIPGAVATVAAAQGAPGQTQFMMTT
jgi:hypothetical protein